MAELTTIARPYAEAAFRIARDANALPVWSEMLRFLADVAADRGAAAALDNPKLTAADKTALILSIAGDRLDANGRNFVRVLVDADRIGVMPQIRTLFETLKNDTDGVSKARIDTAFSAHRSASGRTHGRAPEAVRQKDRDDRERRSRAGRRCADHRRRHRDRRHHRSPTGGDGHPIASLNPKNHRVPEGRRRRDARTPCS
jgi:hypothetical protein